MHFRRKSKEWAVQYEEMYRRKLEELGEEGGVNITVARGVGTLGCGCFWEREGHVF